MQVLNDLVIPVILSLQSDSAFKGLYEIYCRDNDTFVDLILCFANPVTI